MNNQRQGFGLVEVIIAMLILTVGILAMGAATGYMLNQIRASELRTDRMVVVRDAAEQLRAVPWEDLITECQSELLTSDRFTVDCELSLSSNLARIRLVSTGPTFSAGGIRPNVVDTSLISIARPVP